MTKLLKFLLSWVEKTLACLGEWTIIPTALFWLGAVNNEVYEKAKRDDLTLPSLHSDLFLPDADPAINTGVEAMSNAIVDLFANKI